MARYESKIDIGGTSGVCEQIANNMESLLGSMIVETNIEEEEHAAGVYKIGDEIHSTDIYKGESGIISKNITSDNVRDILDDIVRRTGIEDANEFHERTDWFVIVHTHPSGDPSPSASDLMYVMSKAKSIKVIESAGMGYGGKHPVPQGLMAIGEQEGGDIVMTGFTVNDNLPRIGVIDYYEDQAKKIKLNSLPQWFDDDYKREDHREHVNNSYLELIEKITEGVGSNPPILNKCHAIIKGGM